MSDVTRQCEGCGSPLPKMKRKANPRRWCSEKCRVKTYRRRNPAYVARNADLSRQRAAVREGAKPPKPQCENCGSPMKRNGKARFCYKPECRRARYLDQKANAPICELAGCDKPSHVRGLCGPHYRKSWSERFPERSQELSARRRARERGARVESVDRAAVFERDGWRCHLCGKIIEKSHAWPNPRSASIDHIVPLAKGGDHSMANVAAAHLGCNSSKKDRVAGDQLALIG